MSENCRLEWAENHATDFSKSLEYKKKCSRHLYDLIGEVQSEICQNSTKNRVSRPFLRAKMYLLLGISRAYEQKLSSRMGWKPCNRPLEVPRVQKKCSRNLWPDWRGLEWNWSKFDQKSGFQAPPEGQNVPTFGYVSTLWAKTVAQNGLKLME